MAQLSLALPMPRPVPSLQRVLLPCPEDQAQADSRKAILSPILAFRRDPQVFGLLRLKDGTPVSSFSRMVEFASETSGVSSRTIYHWLRDFNQGGTAALADKVRGDKGVSRFFKAYPKAAWLAAYLSLVCDQSVAETHEAIVRDANMLEIPASELPAYETVRVFLKATPAALEVYAKKGQKAYRDRMSPYLKYAHAEYANQIWVGDHMIHDVECMNDCFADAEWGAPVRLRFTAWLDFRSRKFMGASWCWEGSSRSIAAALRRGIAQYGPPEHVYVDNGKDYKKSARGAKPGYIARSPLAPSGWWNSELDSIRSTGFIERIGASVTHCLPHHPQAKCIERAFRTVHTGWDKIWPTYTSGDPFSRPDRTELAMMQHRRLFKAGRAMESNHPRASYFIAETLAWLEQVYANEPVDGEGMDGGTPNQVFEASFNPRQKPTPEPAALALLLAEHKSPTVFECAVKLNNRRYQPRPGDQAAWHTMHAFNERKILVAYDPADVENAAALDLDGHFLAWLQVEELVKFAPGDAKTQARIAESMAQRRHLEKTTRETLTTITLVARQNGAQSPLEAMTSRLQLPANTDLAGIVTQRAPRLVPTTEDTRASMTPAQAARMFFKEQIQEQKTK